MIIQCNKQEFRKMIVSCNESSSCMNCALHGLCDELPNLEKGEFIADCVQMMEDPNE